MEADSKVVNTNELRVHQNDNDRPGNKEIAIYNQKTQQLTKQSAGVTVGAQDDHKKRKGNWCNQKSLQSMW